MGNDLWCTQSSLLKVVLEENLAWTCAPAHDAVCKDAARLIYSIIAQQWAISFSGYEIDKVNCLKLLT